MCGVSVDVFSSCTLFTKLCNSNRFLPSMSASFCLYDSGETDWLKIWYDLFLIPEHPMQFEQPEQLEQ